MSKVDVLLGLQWGDEGKGKIVDVLTPKYDIIARFQGGPNAGHTLEFEGEKHVLHQIPSGIFHEGKINIIGNGVVIDPVVFKEEIEALRECHVDVTNRLVLSDKAQLIIPTHKLLDKALEEAKGHHKIGSTLRGIGPTYQDKYGRKGLRIGDILHRDFRASYKKLKKEHLQILKQLNFEIDIESDEANFLEDIELLKHFKITSTEYLLNEAIKEGKKILAEGAQGALLDIDFGSYPYVTSSSTIVAGACTGLGIPPRVIDQVFGIFKAYCTRVGSGPFPTELFEAEAEALRRLGNEFGATTSRPRRCGWLDIPLLNYACMLNGVTQLHMMKADVLSDMDTIKVCDKYQTPSGFIEKVDYHVKEPIPHYTEQQGWKIATKNNFDALPDSLRQYVHLIEQKTMLPISVISLGPDREETIFKPF